MQDFQPSSPVDIDPDLGVDVVVVGAGIAGLNAARELVAKNLSVIVLESRDRVGGRLRSVEVAPGKHLDVGATWFWPGERNIERLITDLEVAVFAQHLAGDSIYHEPHGSRRLDGNHLDVPSGRFAAGADSLPLEIADQLPAGVVQLERAVSRIEEVDRGLLVETTSGSLAARHVILAVPPALAVDKIRFEPPLPDRIAGLAEATPVWMGAITKVVAHYTEAFWRRDGLAGSAISHYGPMREVHDMSGPDGEPAALFGFVPATSVGQPTVDRDAILAQLIEMFGPSAGEPVGLIVQDWRTEEWTSPPDVERLSAYQAFGHSLYAAPTMNGRLHWASTETSVVNPGHIEGALAAANRAVQAISQDFSRT